MSKASKYVEGLRNPQMSQPEFYDDHGQCVADVTRDGQLNICAICYEPPTLTPAEALRFALWIQDTFGEPTDGGDHP